MVAGIIFTGVAVTLLVTDLLDHIITPFTHVFLMGSSEGKDVIFFTVMGTMFILAPLFREDGLVGKSSRLDKNSYLHIAALLAFITYLTGTAVEVLIRLSMGVSPLTTFISMDPPASTSITHSHVFKASLSPLTGLIVPASSGIHTGSSLAGYIPFLLPMTLTVIPVIYLMGLLSTGDRRDFHVAIVIFATATTIIGIIDGGLFSTPALVGLSGILGMSALRVPFSPGNLKVPTLIIGGLIAVRILLGILGSVPEYYEVTVLEPSGNLDLDGLHVLSEEKKGDRIILKLSSDQNEMELLNKLTARLDGRCHGFFMTWNFFSFF